MFDPKDVRVVRDPTLNELQRAAQDLFASGMKGELLLFHFIGHGFLDEKGELLLPVRDTHNGDPVTIAFHAGDLKRFADTSSADVVILVLDTSFSGAFMVNFGK